MDLSGIESFIPNLAALLNLDPATVLWLGGLLVTFANITSRLIPDDKTGFLGLVRSVCTVIGIYAANRVTSGVTTNDVIKSVIGTTTSSVVEELAAEPQALIPEVTEKVTPAFPKLKEETTRAEMSPRRAALKNKKGNL